MAPCVIASFRRFSAPLRAALLIVPALVPLRAANLPDLFAERIKSCVAVEFTIETETDRQPVTVFGACVDANGAIILPVNAINSQLPASRLKDFKVYRPHSSIASSAKYLGQDALTGWHFVQVEEKGGRAGLVPITAWVRPRARAPLIADEVWSIGLRGKGEDFRPYFLMGRIGLIQPMPQMTAIAASDLGGPGLPVFNRDGAFVGLTINSFGQNYLMFSRRDRGAPIMLVNIEESSVFIFADEVLPYIGRIPQNVSGRPLTWLGVFGLQPVEAEVAKFLKLEDRSAVVISEALEDGPAEKAGLKDRDIILAIDGKPLPRFKPDPVVVSYVQREIDRRQPGDRMVVTVQRDGERRDFTVTLAEEPKIIREAERRYFEKLGFTVREFLYGDGVSQRVKLEEHAGVIVEYVKPNGPAAAAGLGADDWIKEIDGKPAAAYAEAISALAAIEEDKSRVEFVLLASRGSDTAVLRVKLQ